MKKILFILLMFICVSLNVEAQFKQNSVRSLFSDVKAFQVGDAIMILIMEDTQAGNSASSESGRNTSLNGGFDYNANGASGSFGGGVSAGNDFKGSGATSRKESIKSRLSAKIDSVEQNGNLRIKGTRTTKINGELQTITISGTARPVDVRSDNTIYSYNILDLKLFIEGDGSVSEVQEPGLITKFLRILF